MPVLLQEKTHKQDELKELQCDQDLKPQKGWKR